MAESIPKPKSSLLILGVLTVFFCFSAESFTQSDQELKFFSERLEFGEIEVKRNALAELRNFESESASRVALSALRDPSEIVRATATHTVVYLPEEEAVRALLPLLNDKSDYIRRETAHALGIVGNSGAVAALIELLRSDKNREVRAASAAALGRIGDVSAIGPLVFAIQRNRKSKDSFIRRAAARAIGQTAQTIQSRSPSLTTPESFLPDKYKIILRPKYGNLFDAYPDFKSANEVLIGVLANRKESRDVRREAAFALGEIGDSSSIKPLESNLRSQDYYLTEICEEALRKIYAGAKPATPEGAPDQSQDDIN